jgi:hypothetical protein
MYDESYGDEHYESNDVWHNGRGYYYYYYGNGYSYSGSAPTSHVPNRNTPTAPSIDGTKSMPIVLLVYVGQPNFNNYANVNPKAILDEKCTPPPVPEPPAPATPQELPASPETPQPKKSMFDKLCDRVNKKINDWFFRTTNNPNNEKFKQIRAQNDMANEVAGQSVHPDRCTWEMSKKVAGLTCGGAAFINGAEQATNTNNTKFERIMGAALLEVLPPLLVPK